MDLDGHHSRWGGVTSLGTSSGANTAIPAAQFTLAPGKTAATLQYTITAIDDYTPCQQTLNIMVRINEYPDNVIDADCYDDPPEQDWAIREVTPIFTTETIHNYGPMMVGDIDGDGVTEIIAYRHYNSGYPIYPTNGLKIFYYDNATNRVQLKRQFTLTNATNFNGNDVQVPTLGTMAIARYNNNGYIVIQGMDRYLYAYDENGSFVWKSNTALPAGITATVLNIADFNGDYIPEVYTGSYIFSLATGNLLCSSPANNQGGLTVETINAYASIAANVTGGGNLNLVAGMQVYDVTIPAGATTSVAGCSMTVNTAWSLQTNPPSTSVIPAVDRDGTTVVADIDCDGQLEVVVMSQRTTSASRYLYVWKPALNGSQLLGNLTIPSNNGAVAFSVPMVGNIDGDKYPEIVFITDAPNYMYAVKYNPAAAVGSRLSTKWRLDHSDNSGCTGMTLFDFNQDGINEIVYRDETTLRIINGNGAAANVLNTFDNVTSGTLREFPVIADIDGDGEAEIIVSGSVAGWASEGYVRVFKSNGSPWAPARKVWNQYSYNAVNVNEDLTIPISPLNPATKFPGKDGSLDTPDDVQPYNGFLMQQTLIGRNGRPIWTLPNAEYNADPLYDYYSDGDSLRISIDVINMGDAPLQSPFYISVYKKGATEALVKTDSIMQIIPQKGGMAQKVISIRNLTNFLPFDSLIIQLNDKNQGKYVQPECDTTGNRTGEAGWKVMRVSPDLATVQKYYSVDIPVLDNDSLPASLFSGSFYLGDSVSIPPTAGILTAVGSGASSKLVYTNHGNPLAGNIDSFQYRFTFFNPELSAYRTYFAWVYIYVLDDLNGAAGCYGQPHTVNLSTEPAGTTFDWWYNTGGMPLSPLQENPRTITGITADTTFHIRPNVPVTRYSRWGEFPRGYFTIKPANTSGTVATMRWTGLADSLWHNPANWVAVRSMANGSMYETPVSYAPTGCVNVIIPSIVGNFPELVDSAWCNDILMEDRAMLKNPHVLNYRNASVELKLKPSERDRFIMWSAPLSQMVTGDYHYKSKTGEPQFGDFFMNFFQQSNPDNSGSAAARGNFTTTFGSVSQSLQLGKAFNLRVVTTSLSRDSILRFPGETDTYNGTLLGSRPDKYKFVTQGVPQDALGRFDLPVYSGLGSSYDNSGWKLIQVVNPYMAYLRADSFLLYNPALQSGYYYWNGELDGSFTTVGVSGTGNRFVYTEQSTASLPNLIAPLQSFFVAKANQNSQVSTVVMSPRWTTTSPPASYTLRSTQVTSGGILYIKAIQGSRTSSAALVYDPEATSKGDLPVFVYNEIPLTLYAFSPGREALSIRTSNDFQSRATDLGLRVMNAGEMKLEFSGLSTFGHDVYLQDRQLGKTIDLQNNPEYVFTVAKSGTNAIELNDRFSLGMAYTGKGIVTGNESTPSPAALQVSSKDGYLNVQSQGEKIDQLQIYSLTGSLIYSSNSSSVRFNIPLSGGVYIVKGQIGATYYTEKAIVR